MQKGQNRMPKLSQLLGDKVPATLEFPGAVVNVVYRPSVYTREFEAVLERVAEIAQEAERRQVNPDPDAEPMALSASDQKALTRDFYDEALCDLLDSWDLEDDGDEAAGIAPKVIGLTPEAIKASVPTAILIAFVLKLVKAIQGEAGGGRQATQTPPNRAERRAEPKAQQKR
jgi:hypothetical protein